MLCKFGFLILGEWERVEEEISFDSGLFFSFLVWNFSLEFYKYSGYVNLFFVIYVYR